MRMLFSTGSRLRSNDGNDRNDGNDGKIWTRHNEFWLPFRVDTVKGKQFVLSLLGYPNTPTPHHRKILMNEAPITLRQVQDNLSEA